MNNKMICYEIASFLWRTQHISFVSQVYGKKNCIIKVAQHTVPAVMYAPLTDKFGERIEIRYGSF